MSEIKLEELLDLANTQSSKDDVIVLDANQVDIRKFIRAKDIQSADNPVHAKLVYDYYQQWSENPLTYKRFVKYFTMYFKRSNSGPNILFKVTPQSFGLPPYYSFYKDTRFNDKPMKKSKYRGVYPFAGYYIARIQLEDTIHYLGNFQTESEAALAHDRSSYFHFGTRAQLNFPENTRMYEKEAKEVPKKE